MPSVRERTQRKGIERTALQRAAGPTGINAGPGGASGVDGLVAEASRARRTKALMRPAGGRCSARLSAPITTIPLRFGLTCLRAKRGIAVIDQMLPSSAPRFFSFFWAVVGSPKLLPASLPPRRANLRSDPDRCGQLQSAF
jgi:hypothetical protein